MGLIDLFRRTPTPAPVSEAAANGLGTVKRQGYEYGVPVGGTDTQERAMATASTRRQSMEEQFQAYMSCTWVSKCADTVARLVTAGGLELVPDEGDADQTRPPEIVALDQLVKSANDREDGIQLLRSTVTDLMVFGDGFIEIGEIGDVVAALWTLDATTMTVGVDEHGEVSGYYQDVDSGRQASFDADEVIHISLDSPRGGIYGVSPTQKQLVSITTWLFAAACLKEYYRRGMPPDVAIDLGDTITSTDEERFRQQYQRKRLGPRNIGQPLITRVGTPGNEQPPVKELSQTKITELKESLHECRDDIIGGFGLSPAMVGIIESGNLGGGTGESQAKTTHYGMTLPIQNILLEKLNFHLLTRRGIVGWHFQFGEVDYRDSKTVDDIRDQQLRNGMKTLNVLRAEIGEDPVDGGDDPVLVDRQNLVLWADMQAFSKAMVASKTAPGLAAPAVPGEEPLPDGQGTLAPGQDDPAMPGDVRRESADTYRARRLSEAWGKAFEQQRRRINKELHDDVDA